MRVINWTQRVVKTNRKGRHEIRKGTQRIRLSWVIEMTSKYDKNKKNNTWNACMKLSKRLKAAIVIE